MRPHQLETFDVNDLKARGWTKAMIAIYLNESDIAPNSGQSAGRPKQLYFKTQILAIESQASFIARRDAAEPRRLASNALFNEKTERLVNLARSYKFQVPDMPLRQLRSLAKDKFGEAALPSQDLRNEALFLIEQIESACSELAAFHWSYGVREARLVLRRRIYVDILGVYPHLSKTIFELGQEDNAQSA